MTAGVSHREHQRQPEKTVSSRFLTIKRIPSGDGRRRFSCTISKKIARKSTERNRAKRRVRAAIRDALRVDGVYLVQIRKPAIDASFSTLIRECRDLFDKFVGS